MAAARAGVGSARALARGGSAEVDGDKQQALSIGGGAGAVSSLLVQLYRMTHHQKVNFLH